mgnify:CR=1 FL=1
MADAVTGKRLEEILAEQGLSTGFVYGAPQDESWDGVVDREIKLEPKARTKWLMDSLFYQSFSTANTEFPYWYTRKFEECDGDVLEVRRSLEELAIELACQRMTEEDMQALEEAQKAFKAAIDQGDAMKIAETDEAYHDVIYHSTRNKRLVQILNNLREQMYRFRLEYIKDEDKRQILQLEHEKILAALRLRHMAEAKAVARGHIDNQEITVLKNLKERKEV